MNDVYSAVSDLSDLSAVQDVFFCNGFEGYLVEFS